MPYNPYNGNYYGDGSDKKKNGYAYTDKYGYSHVTKDEKTAKEYGKEGSIQEYKGNFGGGYALDDRGERLAVATPGAIDYGNDIDRGGTRWDTNPNNYGTGMAFTPRQQALSDVYNRSKQSSNDTENGRYKPIGSDFQGLGGGYIKPSYDYSFSPLPDLSALPTYKPIQIVDQDTMNEFRKRILENLRGGMNLGY